jgi:hypothetical protein
MGYDIALKKAWDTLQDSGIKTTNIKFLGDEYGIDHAARSILSLSCNTPAKDYYKIIILHYLANEFKVGDISGDSWTSFKELDGGEIYFSAFRKRAIEPILRKYGDKPEAMLERAEFMNGEKIKTGNAGLSIKVFPKVKIGIILWAKDDEFSADCNILFNSSISNIFPTEDVTVLAGIIASLI